MIKARLVGIAVSLAKQYGVHSSAHTTILHQSTLATTGQQALNKGITYELGVNTINVSPEYLPAFPFTFFTRKAQEHTVLFIIYLLYLSLKNEYRNTETKKEVDALETIYLFSIEFLYQYK